MYRKVVNLINLNYIKQNEKLKIALIGALTGFLVFMLIYGPAPLNPANEDYVLTGYLEKDIAQHYAGWKLFRNSPWTFPLGVAEHMEYPYGNSVSYSDSIPLFAVFFKLLSPVLPATFQYLGLFVLISFVLQGMFGALLCSLFADSKIYCGIGSAFFAFAPILVERAFRHCALTAQFFILAALYYYFKNKRSSHKSYLPFYILNGLAITVHPYFLPFTFGIMFAFGLEDFFIGKSRIKPFLHIGASIIISLAVGYAFGAFYSGSRLLAIGYGYFSLNLNSFINPVSPGFTGENNWSAFFPDRPLFGGQVEGFNYLGVGIMAATVIALLVVIIKDFKSVLHFICNRFGIIFSTVALTVFAFSDAVYYGTVKLFDIPYTDKMKEIFGMFRATGRFGYILHYLIILFALYGIYQIFKNKKTVCVILVPFLAVQLYDFSDVLLEKSEYFHNFSVENRQYEPLITQHPFWRETIKRVDGVTEISNVHEPIFGNGIIDLASICGDEGKYINSNFCTRFNYVERIRKVETHEYIFSELGECRNELFIMDKLDFAVKVIENGVSQAFVVNGQLVMTPAIYSEDEIAEFTAMGNFEHITDPTPYVLNQI